MDMINCLNFLPKGGFGAAYELGSKVVGYKREVVDLLTDAWDHLPSMTIPSSIQFPSIRFPALPAITVPYGKEIAAGYAMLSARCAPYAKACAAYIPSMPTDKIGLGKVLAGVGLVRFVLDMTHKASSADASEASDSVAGDVIEGLNTTASVAKALSDLSMLGQLVRLGVYEAALCTGLFHVLALTEIASYTLSATKRVEEMDLPVNQKAVNDARANPKYKDLKMTAYTEMLETVAVVCLVSAYGIAMVGASVPLGLAFTAVSLAAKIGADVLDAYNVPVEVIPYVDARDQEIVDLRQKLQQVSSSANNPGIVVTDVSHSSGNVNKSDV